MLSQHLITRPVFEALFGGDDFTKANPVSQVMQAMVDTLDEANIDAETATLDGFYEHIRMLVGGIDSAEGRQKVIAELYEKFFKKVVPKTASSLGIVYTPVEIVDFINRAVNDLLDEHFDGASLSDEGVHVLDPFTGTGTFIARMIQSGLITPDDLARKFHQELHANEIMLLAYYIAAINIETAFRGAMEDAGMPLDIYESFPGIVLTDTFQMTEADDSMDTVFFPRNNARADRQKSLDIRVIIGNPPYSVGQSSQNDDNANLRYPTLDASIERTYARRSTATLKNSLYDSYVRAIRWASNRVTTSAGGGVVGFVTNGGWIDGNTADGIRHTVAEEFHYVYIFNLRGNQRTSGEQSRKEGGKVFGSGSRNTVAITLLVRKPGPAPKGGARILYRDIGDYLSREEKLEIVDRSTMVANPWKQIHPNAHADWVNLRGDSYDDLVPLDAGPDAIFGLVSNGLKSNRDAWVYDSSRVDLRRRAEQMEQTFRTQTDRFQASGGGSADDASRFVDHDPTKYSWSANDYARVARGETFEVSDQSLRQSLYRPFFRQNLFLDNAVVARPGAVAQLLPQGTAENQLIGLVASGSRSPFGVLATRSIPALHLINSDATDFLGRWRYLVSSIDVSLLEGTNQHGGSVRVSNLNPVAVAKFRDVLGSHITDDDVFHYVYGVLHSPEFRSEFEVNLKKEAPRVPMVADRAAFDAFVTAGAELMQMHIGYDDPNVVKPYALVEEWADSIGPDDPRFEPARLLVGSKKMRYPKVTDADPDSETYGKKIADKTRLIYNDYLTISGIPERAHGYVLGTRSAVDWIIDRWYVKIDKASGIVNDVNEWGHEQGNPRYIVDLIKQVVTVSLRTVEIVDSLPRLRFDENGTHVVSDQGK